MEGFIYLISDPNLVYLLLSFGSLCLLAEVFHPGAILPGITGVICLILAFIGLSNLTFNWLGLALLTLASLLFVIEVLAGLNGLFSLAALVVFVTGSFLLFDTPKLGLANLTVNPLLMGVMTGLM